MKVRIKIRPSGLINGRPWPGVGEVVDLPEHVAEGMAAAGFVEVRPAPAEAMETRESKPAAKRTAPKNSDRSPGARSSTRKD